MTMMVMTQVCRSTVPAIFSMASRGPILPTLSFELGSLHMELVLYILASLASATVWSGVIPGGIHTELTWHILLLSPTVPSHGFNMDPEATRFGHTI